MAYEAGPAAQSRATKASVREMDWLASRACNPVLNQASMVAIGECQGLLDEMRGIGG